MTHEQFEQLVLKLEAQSEQNPKGYRSKVLLLTGLGYGYVLFFLALFLFLLTISVLYLVDGQFSAGSIKLLLITGSLSYFVIKSMMVKMDLPEGYYLKSNEAPELEKVIKELSAKLNTPKIHRIVLDDEFNAAVLQHPKFGLFGPKENILMIGVPLLSSMTREQFTSVLAHELAHISHSDTAFGAFIYRVRATWGQLMHSLEENEQFGTFLFRKFIKWYYPRFSAYTFVMARQEEYAADAASARVTSPETVRDTLCHLAISGQYFYQKYFDELFEESAKTNRVPQPYSYFASSQSQTAAKKVAVEYLNRRLEMMSTVSDTHPSLKERLAAVGMEPAIPVQAEGPAIYSFFPQADKILDHFNKAWVENNAERWNEQVAKFNEAKQRLKELEEAKDLDINGHYERVILTRDIIGFEAAVPLYEEMIEKYPAEEIPAVYLGLGDIYLRRKETAGRGEELVQKAVELGWEAKEQALDMLCEYYYYSGQSKKFDETRGKLAEWSARLEEYEVECTDTSKNNQLIPHDKSGPEVAEAVESIRVSPEILEAYLVRKISKVIPERKTYLLGFKVDLPKGRDRESLVHQLLERYTKELYTFSDAYIYILNGEEELEEAMKDVKGSLIYSAGQAVPVTQEVS